MNENLRLFLDQLTVAPVEIKSEIISIMVSEGCFPARGFKSSIASALLSGFCKIGGKSFFRGSAKAHMIKDEERTDNVFFWAY